MYTNSYRWSAACAALLVPVLAQAHPGHGVDAGIVAGAVHPLSGLDHLMALAAAGLLAGRLGGRAGLAILSAFPACLALGAFAGLAGVEFAAAEAAILVSVLVLAVLAARPPRKLPMATATLAAAFALFHGQAHGIEASAGSAPLPYLCGVIGCSVAVMTAAARLAGLSRRRLAPHVSQAR